MNKDIEDLIIDTNNKAGRLVDMDILLEKIANENPNIDINVIIPHESYILNFIKMFKEKFGDINAYLDKIGISENDRKIIKNKLLI